MVARPARKEREGKPKRHEGEGPPRDDPEHVGVLLDERVIDGTMDALEEILAQGHRDIGEGEKLRAAHVHRRQLVGRPEFQRTVKARVVVEPDARADQRDRGNGGDPGPHPWGEP